jgi:hypothetical protein
MPKKATSSSRITIEKLPETPQGYYMYADGTSRWGTGIYRGMEKPLLIDADNAKEIHNSKHADKVAWYKEKQKEIEEAAKAAKK